MPKSCRPRSIRDEFPCRVIQFGASAFVAPVVVFSLHLITKSMRFYFFQSQCVVIVSSACHFPTRVEKQCKSVRNIVKISLLKVLEFHWRLLRENFLIFPCVVWNIFIRKLSTFNHFQFIRVHSSSFILVIQKIYLEKKPQ